VEQIHGAVLLISGSDDQGYGPAFHDVAAQRLADHGHQYRCSHVVYQDAGHLIAAPPYSPTTRSHTPGPGVMFRHGGTPPGNARARAEGWREIKAFLAEELAPVASGARALGRRIVVGRFG
jgi:dienelactone hydrolase